MDKVKGYLDRVGFMQFLKPVVANANAGACTIVTDVAISTLTGGALTIAAQPDYPRTMKIVLTDAATTDLTGTVTIVGIDQNGVGISDVLSVTAAAASTAVNGVKAFAHVTGATWATVSGTVTASNDKIAVGVGPALGLPGAPNCIYEGLVKGTFDGADEAGTFNATYGTYTPAGTMNGAKEVAVTYRYKEQIPV